MTANIATTQAMPADTPVCDDTAAEILALWESISEVAPGHGAMPASLADFARVSEDSQVIEDTTATFDRLVSLHERTRALAQMTHDFFDRPAVLATLAGSVVLGAAALGHGIAEGYIPAPPVHHNSIAEAFDKSPVTSSLVAAIGAGTVAALTNELLDRGYARFTGLSDALYRLQNGADPKSEFLTHRLTEEERETYGDIVRLSYEVAASHDVETQQRFRDQIRQTMMGLVERLEGSPQAGMIQTTLNDLRDALSSHNQTADHEQSHLENNRIPISGPGF